MGCLTLRLSALTHGSVAAGASGAGSTWPGEKGPGEEAGHVMARPTWRWVPKEGGAGGGAGKNFPISSCSWCYTSAACSSPSELLSHSALGMAPAGLFLGSVCSQQCCEQTVFPLHLPHTPPNYWKCRKPNCPCCRPPAVVWVEQGRGMGCWSSKALSWGANAELAGGGAAFLSPVVP